MSDKLIKKIRTNEGDLQIDYNALANLPDLNNTFCSPNLLINSDFRYPVNQRGQTNYINDVNWAWRYTIDRWALNGSLNAMSVVVNNGTITVTNSGSDAVHFRQWFERKYDSGYYTATVNVVAVSGVVRIHMDDSNQSDALVVGKNVITLSAAPEYFNILLEAGASVDLGYVKLEQGTTATPFVPRLYGEELLLCKRFYQVTKCYRTFWTDLYNNEFVESVPYGIDMRAIPRVTANITDSYNVTDLGVSDNGDVCAYRVTYKPTESDGIGHRFEMYVTADAEIC